LRYYRHYGSVACNILPLTLVNPCLQRSDATFAMNISYILQNNNDLNNIAMGCYHLNWAQKLKASNIKVGSIVSIATFISVPYKESLLRSLHLYATSDYYMPRSKCNTVKIRKCSNLQNLFGRYRCNSTRWPKVDNYLKG